jgi:hypothetical protein
MFSKIYLNRQQTKFMSSEYPIGDPTGGAAYGEFNDPVSAIIGAGGAIIGSSIGASAAEDAAKMQSDTAAQQITLQKQIFDTQNTQQAPYRTAGYNSLNTIGTMLPGQYQQYDAQGNPTSLGTGSGYLTKQFTNEDLNANLSPNYAFNLEQGQGGVRNLANSSGGLIGGNAYKGLIDYNQNFAGNAYQNAFANFQGQRSNIYNTLAGIAGIGQTGQTASNNLATNYGTNTANLATGSAASSAAGRVGAANAYSGGIQNATNMYNLSSLLNQGGNINSYNNLPTYGGSPSFNNSPINTGTVV